MIYSASMAIKVEAPTLSQKTADSLQNAGFVVVTAEGLSIQGQRDKGRKFWSRVHEGDQAFERLNCEPSQFAYHPDQLILPNSVGKPLDETVAKMLDVKERQLRKGKQHIPGNFTVAMFAMQEVVGISYDSMKNGKPILGDVYTWTTTHHVASVFDRGKWVNKEQVAVVGLPIPEWGPSVGLSLPHQASARIGIAFKVVPL